MSDKRRMNWGTLWLFAGLGVGGWGIYEIVNNLIDNGNISAAQTQTDSQGVERKLVGPNMFRVTENGFINTFNFASGQLISTSEKSETITLFSAMNNESYVKKTLSDACNIAASTVQTLDGHSTWSLLPWKDSDLIKAQQTASNFITAHCPVPPKAAL